MKKSFSLFFFFALVLSLCSGCMVSRKAASALRPSPSPTPGPDGTRRATALVSDPDKIAVQIFPKSPVPPVGAFQSFFATVTGTENQALTWSTTCGLTPVVDGMTAAYRSLTTRTCTVTATSVANPAKSDQATVSWEPKRPDLQASATHPRIWITPDDVTAMQAKTVNGNIVWAQGALAGANGAANYMNAHFCWSSNTASCTLNGETVAPGEADSHVLADDGSGQYNQWGNLDQWRAMYALMSLIDPDTGSRSTWALHALDMLRWELVRACGITLAQFKAGTTGPCSFGAASDPYRGWKFPLDNRAQATMQNIAQAVDWIYPSLTSDDKALIRNVFRLWGKQISASFTASDAEHPAPVGTYQSTSLVPSIAAVAWSSNNYSSGHFLALASLGLALDPADDPNVGSCAGDADTVCADGSANTVRAYATAAVKAWLYRLYANFENGRVVSAAYGLADPYLCADIAGKPAPCFGGMSGGMSYEGSGYGVLALDLIFRGLYTLYRAGKLDPSVSPQAAFISSAFWDKLLLYQVHALLPHFVGPDGGNMFYPYFPFGDEQATTIQAGHAPLFRALQTYHEKTHEMASVSFEKWFQYNAGFYGYTSYFPHFVNGMAAFESLDTLDANSDGDFANFYPYAPAKNAYDPRPTMPVELHAASTTGGFYHYLGRSDLTEASSGLHFLCGTSYQNHAHGLCGRIDYYRKGEPVIQALGGYLGAGQAAYYNNLPAYQWSPSFTCSHASIDETSCQQGGQATNGWARGASTMRAYSSNARFYYGATDAAGAYSTNLDAASDNVTLAQRDLLWLKPDTIVVYDRGESKVASFKQFTLDLTGTPTVSGKTATMTTGSGSFAVTSLLPTDAAITVSPLIVTLPWDNPVKSLLISQGAASTATRMLHVLQATDTGVDRAPTVLVQSASGLPLDGAIIGTTAVLFPRNAVGTGAVTATYVVPDPVQTHYVAGLVPASAYSVSFTSASGATTITIASSCSATCVQSDSGGVLALSTKP